MQCIYCVEYFKCEDGILKIVEEVFEYGVILFINVVCVIVLYSGLLEMKVKEIWIVFEKNGVYQFNKLYFVVYFLISY